MTTLTQFSSTVNSTMETIYQDGAGSWNTFLNTMRTEEASYAKTESERLQAISDFYQQRAENTYATFIEARIQAESAGDANTAQFYENRTSKLNAMIQSAEAGDAHFWARSMNTTLSSPMFKAISKYGGFAGDVVDVARITTAFAQGDYDTAGQLAMGVGFGIGFGTAGGALALAFGAMAMGPAGIIAVAAFAATGAFAGTKFGEWFWEWSGAGTAGEWWGAFIADMVNTTFSLGEAMAYDPLTFDLDADGIGTLPLDGQNSVLFDHNGDGVKTGTGWVSPDDGFLVRDINGNGTIDTGRELFGDNTILNDGTLAASGFEALADLDTNADGVIDVNDAAFTELRIWQDANSDAVTQAGELLSLNQAGIASINTTYNGANIAQDGNTISALGSYTKTDGSLSTMGSVASLGNLNLAASTFYTDFITPVALIPQAEALPTMQGSGLVRDMREAA